MSQPSHSYKRIYKITIKGRSRGEKGNTFAEATFISALMAFVKAWRELHKGQYIEITEAMEK